MASAGRSSITRSIADGTLDAELGALLWLLVEARVPVVISGEGTTEGSGALLGALLDLLPPDIEPVALEGTADIVGRARQALERGDAMGATLDAGSLEAVFETLSGVGFSDDDTRALGVVLIVRAADGAALRVVAAHYLRPVERDGHGHLQRRPPAVLATWDSDADEFEHFAWGITPELAHRVGRERADFDRALGLRRAFLAHLVDRGILDAPDVKIAVEGYRTREQAARAQPERTH